MMRWQQVNLIAFCCLIFSVEFISAQVPGDKLSQWVSYKTHDTDYVNLSIEIAEQLNYIGKLDTATILADSALQVSQRLHFSAGEAKAFSAKGKIDITKSNFKGGVDYILRARAIFDSIFNKSGSAGCILQIGILYYTQKNYKDANTYFRQADSAFRELKEMNHLATAQYLEGRCLIELKEYAVAEPLLQKAAIMKEQLNDMQGKYECHWALADLFLKSGELEKSKQNYFECLRFFRSDTNKEGVSMMEFGIGEVYLALNKKDSAEKYFLIALAVGDSVNYPQAIEKSAQALATLYSSEGNFKKAYAYQTEYFRIRDSLYNKETAQKIDSVETVNSLKKKQAIIDLQKQKIKNEQAIRYLLLGSVILLVILVMMAYQRYRFKQQTNRILENKNRDLGDALSNLKSAQTQLVQHEKMASLGQLTAGIAHEINNPINFVTSSVNPLKRNFADVKKLLDSYEQLLSKTDQQIASEQLKQEFDLQQNISETESLLSGIEEGSRRTAEIVKGLRNFSRLDTEERKKLSINDGIESTMPLLQNKLTQQNIEVIKSFENLPRIDGYPGQLNQVFMNLFTNAIDAIGTNGKIFITTSQQNNFVKISFRDTGCGMSEEVQEKIFDPFFTTKEIGKGTGLGLSISYGIIEKHSGKIEVKSEVGKGSEFTILLPA